DLQEQIPAESTLSAEQFHTLMAMDPVATVMWKPPSESDEREWADAMLTIPARRSVIIATDGSTPESGDPRRAAGSGGTGGGKG
ncbi:hypothetical protein, partial [Klebsiella pneumoniae]|uniref:hypothetical protein n=1 Tax=Klebsiella pneumoniae TaxID=573 RepID=UPI0022B6B666